MGKINKYKQNNHNARGANRPRRPSKINFKATAGKATRPAVQLLTISNIPSNILQAIDELAARQDRSHSSFVRRELQRIVAEYQAKEVLSKSR